MNDRDAEVWFQSFDCPSVPLAENTPATPRPLHRPRWDDAVPTESEAVLFSFECVCEPLPPGTPASPRPPGRPREVPGTIEPADEAFARDLAERVVEYTRTHPAGLTPEQLASLVHQFLVRRAG